MTTQCPLLIIGLDCIGSDILDNHVLKKLPNLAILVAKGLSGVLTSTVPPITIPAWTSMLSGRDPGELGIYGFRNRPDYRTYNFELASSTNVYYPRIWDYLTRQDESSIVVGVPQTWPAPPIKGVMVSGFEVGKPLKEGRMSFAWPDEIREAIFKKKGYLFDVPRFRNVSKEKLKKLIFRMTEQRFELFQSLIRSNPWRLAMWCEIGPDRLHHCFWSDHDPTHPNHNKNSRYKGVIMDYYKLLDRKIGKLVKELSPDTRIVIVSDHGATPMLGGVCINQLLLEKKWLSLKGNIRGIEELTPEMIDWSSTKAWSTGGFYARIFLNVKGRDRNGIVAISDIESHKRQLTQLLSRIRIDENLELCNQVFDPLQIYRSCIGVPPDLMVHFENLSWRSIGSVGHEKIWVTSNNTGHDEANHSMDGMYIINGNGISPQRRNASIYDIAPSLLELCELPIPSDLKGTSLVQIN